MFGGNFWGAASIGSDDHLTKERDPPPRPTKLEFPQYVPSFEPHALSSKLSVQLRHKICHSKSYLDVSDADLKSLNIRLEKDVSISSLVPDDRFNCRPLPFDTDLQSILDEIGTENEDGFREVLRMTPLPGRKKPRLAYARNFFGSLEDVARYFDDSKDDYYRIPTRQNSTTSVAKPSLVTSSTDGDMTMNDTTSTTTSEDNGEMKEVYKGYRIASAESLSPGTRLSMLKNLLKTTMHKFHCRDHEPIPQPREKFVIRGVRVQSIQYQFCVARIPEDVKLARARQVEGPIMAVATREELRFKEKTDLHLPDKAPFVGERFDLFREIGCMLILAAQRSRAKNGEDVAKAEDKWWVSKQRWGGGPTKWGQLASEIFEDEDPSWSQAERALQEEKRRRQAEDKAKGLPDSKLPVNPKKLGVEDLIAVDGGTDKTKATALPGIPAGAASTLPVLPTDLDLRPKKKKMRSMERPPGDEAVMRDGRRVMYMPQFKQKWYTDWQKLRPNTPTTDDKVISKKIGGEHDDFDSVYMLTSANHHVALVKMLVHADYLAWLESGREVPDDEEETGLKKNVLYVSRTRWFDMLNVQDRKDFVVGLWALFGWINRDYIPKEERERMELDVQDSTPL